jgi:hypothetical protein
MSIQHQIPRFKWSGEMSSVEEFPPLMLCTACQLLFSPRSISKPSPRTVYDTMDTEHRIFGDNEFYFLKTRKDVKDGRKRGCALCQVVVIVEKRCGLDDQKAQSLLTLPKKTA